MERLGTSQTPFAVVMLTSIYPEVALKEDDFNCDPSITDPALIEIAERCSTFFKSFIKTKQN